MPDVRVKSRSMGGTYGIQGEMRSAYEISVRNPEGNRLLVKHRHRWEVNIKMDLKETGCGLDSSVSV